MNFPGVIQGDEEVLSKLGAFEGRVIDGHCPRLSGLPLNAYAAAGIGSDHESTEIAEARERLRLGMRVFLREGTAARNLRNLVPLITRENERRLCLCTDDRHCQDLLDEGSIDYLIRVAIAEGVDPMTAFRMASLNAAEYFRLHDRGGVAPGRRADLVVFSDLESPVMEMVFKDGALVARTPADLLERTPVPCQQQLFPLPSAAGATPGRSAEEPPARAPRAEPGGGAVDGWEARVLAEVPRGDGRSVEDLATALAHPVDRILATLLELELAGQVKRLPGPLYAR